MNYLNLLINPVKFFKQVAEKEKVSLLIPIVILLIIVGLTAVLAGTQVSTLDMPAEQLGMVKAFAIGGGVIAAIIGLAVAVAVKAAIFNFVLKKMGGEGSFKQATYIVGLTYFPKIIQTIINIIFLKPVDMNAVAKMDWVGFFAGIVNVFNIWQIVLTIIGLAIGYGVSYKKAAIPVIGFEVVAAGLSLGSSLLAIKSAAGLTTLS